jgi:hypothetical protein
MVVKRVKPLSLAKVAGVLYALMGLLMGGLFSLVGLAGAMAMPDTPDATVFPAAVFGAFFGIGAVVFLPIFYGCLGFITSLVGALLYNVVAATIGGVEIEVA